MCYIDKSIKQITIFDRCRDYDGKVTPEEVAAAAMYLKDTLGNEGVQELISNLSKDTGQLVLAKTFFLVSYLILSYTLNPALFALQMEKYSLKTL